MNSILSQYTVNLYTAQHKISGNVNLLPMPDYATRQSDIERIVNAIIDIKRKWFSLDETNLEYHGLIAQMELKSGIEAGLDKMQELLTDDYARYVELVKENDDLWMDLADIDRGSEFRQTLNDYKARRPYEELLAKGDYDWSHLAMSMYPARVAQKAKKDWCMALTHGLEHICENKSKEKKTRKKKADAIQTEMNFD